MSEPLEVGPEIRAAFDALDKARRELGAAVGNFLGRAQAVGNASRSEEALLLEHERTNLYVVMPHGDGFGVFHFRRGTQGQTKGDPLCVYALEQDAQNFAEGARIGDMRASRSEGAPPPSGNRGPWETRDEYIDHCVGVFDDFYADGMEERAALRAAIEVASCWSDPPMTEQEAARLLDAGVGADGAVRTLPRDDRAMRLLAQKVDYALREYDSRPTEHREPEDMDEDRTLHIRVGDLLAIRRGLEAFALRAPAPAEDIRNREWGVP